MKTSLQVTIKHKLFHNNSGAVLAKVRAHVNGEKITFGKLQLTPDVEGQKDYVLQSMTPAYLFPLLRERIPGFLERPLYCIVWGEENCVESNFKIID